MNAFGIAIVWCIVQVTLMSLLAAGLYLLVRRLRPAAAGPTVFAGLIMIVLLSLMMFSPWPRWSIDLRDQNQLAAKPADEKPNLQSQPQTSPKITTNSENTNSLTKSPSTENIVPSVKKSSIASGASIDDFGETDPSDSGADRLEPAPVDASDEVKTQSTPSAESVKDPLPPATIDLSLANESRPTNGRPENQAKTPEPRINYNANINTPEIRHSRASDAKRILQSCVDELSQPQAADPASGWRWPEMVAILLLSAMACGFLWLVLGVVAVRRQSLRGWPVHDSHLLELVDVLRAELSCRRPVEVRQSDELVTAATVGWRKPVLLLPNDWTRWTPEQCRAVLAHEIAHARSHDFMALLCGQLGLILHFYHPVVHWLMNRLRLEQELAADAAAASISGGQRQYLTTIAELALSQQDRPLLWPARTFLPTRNTFLRRIAMLRDSKLNFDRLSPVTRMLTIGVVVLGGLMVAGLRAPAAPRPAFANENVSLNAEKDTAKPSEPDNILLNSGMEQGNESADNWIQGNQIDGVKYSWDKNVASEGKASLSIEKSANRYFPIAGWSQTVERKGDLPFLEVSAQVKTKKMFKAVLDVIFLDKNDQWISHEWAAYIGDKTGSSSPANHDWKKYSGTVKIPEGTAKISVELQDYGPGKVWFDDVQVRYVKTKSPSSTLTPEKKSAKDDITPEKVDSSKLLEPQVDATEKISMKDTEPSNSSGKIKELSFVGESTTDKMSFADSGFAMEFERPADMKSINAVKIFGTRYGRQTPPTEKFHIYLLDENRKVLEQIAIPYEKVDRGQMKWNTFEFPAVQVPEKFFVALWFDAQATKGVFMGKDMNVEQTHSWIGLPDTGYEKVDDRFDWMIRAVVSDDEGKQPSRPKVKTYGPEVTADTESTEAVASRTWNDATGSFSLEAEFAGIEDGKVKLKKADGNIVPVPLDRLSKEDQDYVAQQSNAMKSSGNSTAKELARDDGKNAGQSSIAGGGHAVRFEVDSDSNYVTSVSLFGSRYGEARPPKEDFNVWICDEHFKPIATFHFPYSSFARSAPAWKSFKVKPTKVPKNFIVCFGFNPQATKGVFVCYDGEGSGNSMVGIPGKGEPRPFQKGDWLIRCKVENR